METNSQNRKTKTPEEKAKEQIQQNKNEYIIERYEKLLQFLPINEYKDIMHRIIVEVARSEPGKFADSQKISEGCDQLYCFFEAIEELENPNLK